MIARTTSRLPVTIALTLTLMVVAGGGATASGKAPTGPTLGHTVLARPAQGVVRVKARGARAFSRLTQARVLTTGATIDASRGTLQVIAAGPGGRGTQRARISAGAFVITQPRAGAGEVRLRLVGGTRCTRGSKTAPRGALQRHLKVATSGRFATIGCFERIGTVVAKAKARQSAAGGPGGTGGGSTWEVWEYSNGWKISSNGDGTLQVTDLIAGTTQRVNQLFLYDRIYSVRPPLKPGTGPSEPAPTTPTTPSSAILDPVGDLLPCGFVTCKDVDLRAASIAVANGQGTFTVESYAPFSDPPTVDYQIWTVSSPTTPGALDGDYHVHICMAHAFDCTAGTVDVVGYRAGAPPTVSKNLGSWTLTTPTVLTVTFPLASIGSPSTFQWAVGSETCGWRDKIPDTGAVTYPQATGARAMSARRGPTAKAAC